MFNDPVVITLCCAGLAALAMTGRFLALILLPEDHWLARWLDRDMADGGGGWFFDSSSSDGSDGGCDGGDGGD